MPFLGFQIAQEAMYVSRGREVAAYCVEAIPGACKGRHFGVCEVGEYFDHFSDVRRALGGGFRSAFDKRPEAFPSRR